ncbi:hypothetical protein ACFL1B_03005 [Nanoarchaeota archaeon]
MNGEDIEDWMDLQQKHIEEAFENALNHGQDVQKCKEKFHHEIKTLLSNYEKRYHDMWHDEKRNKSLHKPINQLKKDIEKRKKKFNKEYKKLKNDVHAKAKKFMEGANKNKSGFRLKFHRWWHNLWNK